MFSYLGSLLDKLSCNNRLLPSAGTFKIVVLVSSFGIIYCVSGTNVGNKFMNLLLRRLKWRGRGPTIIFNDHDCLSAVQELRKNCELTRVIGLDCEWVSEGKRTNKVALLQLASIDGYCSLFRLCALGHVPNSLKELLSDKSIIKTGVAVNSDASRLSRDYGVVCKGLLDLRHLAKAVDALPVGLGRMSLLYLNKELDKDWKIRCSNWEAKTLSERQIDYASNDALVSVKLFEYFNDLKLRRDVPWYQRWFWSRKQAWQHSEKCWRPYVNIGYNQKGGSGEPQPSIASQNKSSSRKFSSRPLKDNPRQTPLYHNIYLEAPDGEVLCTCDDSKAAWYLTRELAEIVSEEPLRLRLTFEPSARKGVGDEYYALPKNNECAVCGSTEGLRKKNIIPLEYKKNFPLKMKDHCSHDVLPLCLDCHLRSSYCEQQLKTSLAEECNAPITSSKCNQPVIALDDLKYVRSAAKALLNGHCIPEARREELRGIIIDYFRKNDEEPEIDDTLLENLSKSSYSMKNEEYRPHGLAVVEFYQKKFSDPHTGLMILEKMFRKNFIDSMQPEFLPKLWSINYEHVNRK